jgi:hypothetical protein
MLTKPHLQQLAESRLIEAAELLGKSLPSGAYYLAGYAAELGLKAIIAGKFPANEIPDKGFVNSIYTHSLTVLVDRSGLRLI